MSGLTSKRQITLHKNLIKATVSFIEVTGTGYWDGWWLCACTISQPCVRKSANLIKELLSEFPSSGLLNHIETRITFTRTISQHEIQGEICILYD